jgi:GAF domain-containing protein
LLGIGLVVPLILRFARAVAARMLRVTSQASFHSLLSEPEALTALTALQDDLPALAATLTRTAAHVFHAPAAVLLLLDEASASYQWHQSVSQGNHDAMALAHTLRRHLGSSSPSMPPFADNEFSAAWWIEASKLAPLLQIRRPLFVRELVQIHEHGGLPNGIFRFLRHPLPSTLPERSQVEGSLLVPIRWQGRLIAVLLLAARESAQQDGYGGPDFEPLAQFVTTCTPALAQARLLSRVTLRMQVVESLSQRLPRHAATSLAETAQALTEVVAAVLRVQATLWHREATMGKIALSPQERGWFCLAMSLSPEDTTTAGSRQAQALAFLLAVQGQERFVSGLEHAPAQRLSAQVCLPLGVQEPSHQDALDVLVLTYAEPHHFAADEQMVLRQLARHCASSLHHTRLLVEIHQALHQQQVSEQQKHVALTRLLTTVQQAIESKRLLLTSARDAAAPRTARYVKREQHAGLLEEKGAPSFFAYEQASWLRSVKELLVLLEEDTHHVSRLHEASSDDLSTRVRREILTILAEKDLVASLPGEPRSLVLICRPSRLQMFLEDVLRIAGYPVQVYASGDALLDALGKHPQPPSLILLEPAAASLPLSALGLAFSKYWTYHGRLPLLLLPLGPTHIFSAEHPEDQDLQNSSGLALVRLASPLRVSNLLHSIARVLEDSEMTR